MLVIGGGSQALKRIKGLLEEGCQIDVIAESVVPEIDKAAAAGQVRLRMAALEDTRILEEYRPFLVIASTDRLDLNRKITDAARSLGILAYSSDCPEKSDFGSVSTITVGDYVKVAVSTSGRSPIMAKKIREAMEPAVREIVTEECLGMIRTQEIARESSRDVIRTQERRRRFLYAIADDPVTERLIKDRDFTGIQRRIMTLLEDWA